MEEQISEKPALNILSLEDSLQDFEIIRELLIDTGYHLKMDRVENEQEFVLSLRQQKYDIILADFHLPQYDALSALQKATEICSDVPFVVVSGTVGEEAAVELIKQGAVDYILKDRLGRLPFAIQRSLEEAKQKEARKQAELELAGNYALLRIAGEAARFGGWSIDLQNSTVIWSDIIADIHEMPRGYSPSVEEGINFYAPEWRDKITRIHTNCAQKGIPYDEEMEIITQKGKRVWVRTIGEAVKDEHGKIVQVFGSFQDIHERKRVEAQLQQQERLAVVGQLAAGIAHDFNNIMAVIILYALMLEKTEDLSERNQERIAVINQQAWHASRLIEQILDFSRRAVLEEQSLDILPLLKEQVKFLRRTVPENIQIALNFRQDDFTVIADPTRIQQMITNLAVNARDAMPEGGILGIDLERITVEYDQPPPLPEMEPGEWVKMTVMDTGIGIAPDLLVKIFEPFFTTKDPEKGSGLGLAQVHGIVGLHKGHIDVESTVGEGTTFTIYLPAQAAHSANILTGNIPTTARGQGEVVLIVEDKAALREALKEILEMLDYKVLEAKNGLEALVLMASHGEQIALVLSDVIMPEMGGVALLKALRENRWQTPVILLTGHVLKEDYDELQAQGVTAWLTKPPSLDQLAQAIANALHPS